MSTTRPDPLEERELASEQLVDGRLLKVWRDRVLLPDGCEGGETHRGDREEDDDLYTGGHGNMVDGIHNIEDGLEDAIVENGPTGGEYFFQDAGNALSSR